MTSTHDAKKPPEVGTLVEVIHISSGAVRELSYEGETHTLVWLRWPLSENLAFARNTGLGTKKAKGWLMTDAGRAAIGIPHAPKAPSPKARKKVTKKPESKVEQVDMFCVNPFEIPEANRSADE